MPDDISLNLGRARFDRIAARAQVSVSPHTFVDGVIIAGLQLRVRSHQFLGHLLEALVQFTPENLLNGPFRAGHSGGADATEGAHLVAAHNFNFRIALRQLLSEDRIFRGRAAITARRARPFDQSLHVAAINNLKARAERAALMHERAHGHLPSFIHFADDIFHRHTQIVEEEFVELRLAGHLAQRTDFNPRRLHVHQKHSQALVLRHSGIGTHDEFAPGRRPSVAVPYFLAVHYIVVTFQTRFTTHVGQIGTGVGFGKTLAPDLFRAEDLGEISFLLRFCAKCNDGWTDDSQTQHVGQRRRAGQSHLLPEDDLLHQACAAAAIFLRPGNAGPSALVELALPAFQIIKPDFQRFLSALVPVPGDVGGEPRAQLVTKLQFFRAEIQVHTYSLSNANQKAAQSNHGLN